MPSTTTLSGIDGDVQVDGGDVAHITAWSFEQTSNNPDYVSSDTAGYTERVAGAKDGSGSFDFVYDTGSAVYGTIVVGTKYTLTLKLNGSVSISVPAIIDSISLDVEVNGGPIGGSANFSTNGQWTNPS